MHKTASQVSLWIAAVVSSLFVVSCSSSRTTRIGQAREPVDGDLVGINAKMLADLRKRASSADMILSNDGLHVLNDGCFLAWVSTDSPTGEGLIGIYDHHLKLNSWRRTDPLLHCRPLSIRGIGEVILFVDWGTGSGQMIQTLHLVDAACLKEDIWCGVVSSWEEGLDGRNIGHRIDGFLSLVDINNDGAEDLLFFAATRRGINTNSMLISDPYIRNTVYSYSSASRRFEQLLTPGMRIAYPQFEEHHTELLTH